MINKNEQPDPSLGMVERGVQAANIMHAHDALDAPGRKKLLDLMLYKDLDVSDRSSLNTISGNLSVIMADLRMFINQRSEELPQKIIGQLDLYADKINDLNGQIQNDLIQSCGDPHDIIRYQTKKDRREKTVNVKTTPPTRELDG